MKKTILTALAVLLFGTIVLPGCFYAGPGWWYWDPDHDDGRHRHREWRERHGAVTPQQDDRRQHDDNARRGHDNDAAG